MCEDKENTLKESSAASNTQNIAIHESEPYLAIATEVIQTAMEENLSLSAVVKAIKTMAIQVASERYSSCETRIAMMQSELKAIDSELMSIRKA